MKKILIGMLLILPLLGSSANASIYEAPNAGNLNFYPMMQRQREAQETLDFVNKPETYKQRREAKDNENMKRKSNFNPNYSPNYGGAFLQQVHPIQMQFTKDNDGSIKIKGVKPGASSFEESR